MNILNKLAKQASFLLGSNLFAAGANFCSMIILAKCLSAQHLGAYVLLLAYILFLSALFSPQAWQGLIKFTSQNPDNIKKIIKCVFIYDMVSAGVGFVVSIFFAPYFIDLMNLDKAYTVNLQIMSLYILINQTSSSIGILRYFNQFKLLALQNIIASISLIVGVLTGWYFSWSMLSFFMWSIFSLAIGISIINIKAFKLYCGNNCIISNLNQLNDRPKGLLNFNFYAHLTSIVDLPVKQLDTILIGSLVAVEASGVYKIIKQIGTLTTKLTGPVTQVLYPELNKQIANKNFNQVNFFLKRITLFIALFAIPVALFLGGTSSYWLPTLFNDYFLNYQVELAIYLFIHAVSVSFLTIHPVFLAFGHIKKLLALTIISNTMFIIVAILLAPEYGLLGVIVAVGVQYITTIIIKMVIVFFSLRTNVTALSKDVL